MQMPPSGGYVHLLCAVEMTSSYIMARPLRSKSSEHLAKALLSIFYENSFFPTLISSDEGTEMNNQIFALLCKESGITHTLNHFMNKNSNKVESSNSRIVNLLKREIANTDKWPEAIPKICFALNNCNMIFGPTNILATPNYIFNTRDLVSAPHTSTNVDASKRKADANVKALIKAISGRNLIDTPSLYVNIQNRNPSFAINETVLAWAEFVLGKKKLGRGLVKTKLKQYWVKAKVVKRLGQIYILRLPDGSEKRYHKRQMKKYTLEDVEVNKPTASSSIDNDSL